jgi:hypothetical protein
VDGDGRLDAVVGTRGFAADPAQVLVLQGNGAGAFDAPVVTPVPDSYGIDDVELGDIDEDGHLDVTYAAQGTGLHVLFGDGAGGLTDEHYLHPAGDHVADAAVADVTGDGTADVASAGGQLAVFPNALDGARDHD